jgi:hypothetical protein
MGLLASSYLLKIRPTFSHLHLVDWESIKLVDFKIQSQSTSLMDSQSLDGQDWNPTRPLLKSTSLMDSQSLDGQVTEVTNINFILF